MIVPTIEKARYAFESIQTRDIAEMMAYANCPPGIVQAFYINALLREALGIAGDYKMERKDPEMNTRWLGRYVICNPRKLLYDVEEIFTRLITDFVEVQKIVFSRQFGRAEEFMKKHVEVLEIGKLRNRNRAAANIAVINEAIFLWFYHAQGQVLWYKRLHELSSTKPNVQKRVLIFARAKPSAKRVIRKEFGKRRR